MLYQILGVKCLDFKNEDGDKIQGIKLYCSTSSEDEDVFGETVDSFFIPTSSERYGQFAKYCTNAVDIVKLIKTYFDVEFNRKGKPVSFTWLGVDGEDKPEQEQSKGHKLKSTFTSNKSEIVSEAPETKNV